MLKLAVIADDITGAADTGVQFLRCVAPVYLVNHRSLPVGMLEPLPQALSIFTSSRSVASANARRIMDSAVRAISGLRPQRVYKKIDSALRGHIGVELEAMMAGLDIPMSFIVPAFPEQGRTTKDGIHRIHGVPVAETEMGNDPLSPVTESCLPKWIGAQARLAVAHIGLETMDAGSESIAHEIVRRHAHGARHFTFDTLHAVHLERIIDLAQSRFRNALLCGSAGLAQSWARRLTPRGDRDLETVGENKKRVRIDGHLLLVCGSASETLRRQVDELVREAPVADEVLDPLALVHPDHAASLAESLQRSAAKLAGSDLVLRLALPLQADSLVNSQRLIVKFAEFAGAVMARMKPAGLFLSGGDTALEVLDGLQVEAVRLEGEISSGVVAGTLVGGILSGRPVVTKAGSFGAPQALLELHHALRGCGDRSPRLPDRSDLR